MKNKGNKNPLPSSDVRGIQITSHEKKKSGPVAIYSAGGKGGDACTKLGRWRNGTWGLSSTGYFASRRLWTSIITTFINGRKKTYCPPTGMNNSYPSGPDDPSIFRNAVVAAFCYFRFRPGQVSDWSRPFQTNVNESDVHLLSTQRRVLS